MRLIVGLGNPGARYARNRHNIGFMAVDAIARRHGFAPFRARFKGECAEGAIGDRKVLLLKPQTFMNASGESVVAATQFFKIAPGEVAVLYDELDLAEGKVRVKRGGGAAGHNGIRSIDALFANDFWRVRIGIDHPGAKELVLAYVLQNFPAEELPWVERTLDAIAEAVPLLAADDAPGFMTKAALLTAPTKEAKEKEKGDKGMKGDKGSASGSS
jgi:PTH1 family peptidyl-tRNA hydrolase